MSGTAWLVLDDRQTPLPAGWEPLTGHRKDESWTWRLLDLRGNYLGDLDRVEGGQLRFNVFADTRGTGSLTWSGWLEEMPDWRQVLVQPVYTATLMDGSSVYWPLGAYMCTSPAIGYDLGGWVSVEVALYDQTLRLRRARLSNTSGVKAGTVVVDHIRSLMATQTPLVRHALEDSGATLRSSMVWDPDTPWLTIMNELLAAAGMVALWADADGFLRSSAYVRPQDRPLVWQFTEGVQAVHEPDLTHTRDDFDVPNRVTAISRSDEGTPALRSQVRLDDYDPTHPLSHAVTGEWVDRVEAEVEATSVEVLKQRAERWLWEGVAVTSTVTLTHAPLPLELQQRTSVRSGGLVIPSATVQSIDITCTPGEDWTTTVREVAA